MFRVKRVYEPPSPEDGARVLVERLWPRGVRKEALAADWMKDVAPSPTLRTWYGHEVERWEEFQARYRAELDAGGAWRRLAELGAAGPVTLLYSARDPEHNSAVVLQRYLEERVGATVG